MMVTTRERDGYSSYTKQQDGDKEMRKTDMTSTTAADRNTYSDRIRGCLIGGAAGDALGYAVEFDSLKTIRKRYGEAGITKYEKDFSTGVAVFSDDTQMTLFTADGIMAAMDAGVTVPASRKLYPYVYSAYLDWYRTQGGTPARERIKDIPHSSLMDVPDLNVRRAPGITCMNALSSPKKRDLYKPINSSKGCGGIMRTAPVGLLYPDASLTEIVEMGAEISAITHGHPLGCFPSGIFSAIVRQAVYSDEERSLAVMIGNAVNAARELYGRSDCWDDLEALIDKAVCMAGNARSDTDNIRELGEGWVAEETLAIAVYCALRYEHDFSGGIIAAVNHSGDSDSTGAVTGNILGALHGYESIDDKWKRELEMKGLLLRMADRMASTSEYHQDQSV